MSGHNTKTEILSARVERIISDIEHLQKKKDLARVEDELGRAIDHLRNAIDEIAA